MAARDWIEVREHDGKTYLIQHFEVDTHEGFTIHSSHNILEATEEDIERARIEQRKREEKQGLKIER